MSISSHHRLTAALVLLVLGLSNGAAQRGNPPQASGPFQRLSGLFQQQRDALGGRALTAGKEQSIYAGEFLDGITGKRLPLRIVHQAPGLVRLEGLNSPQSVVVFDGKRASGVLTKTDELLLETFTGDTAEGMFDALQGASAFRFLGARFAPQMPGSAGAPSDIFEVMAPIPPRTDQLARIKLYYFDSDTGLLQKTRYEDQTVSPAVKVETRFSQWRRLDDSMYAGRIERFENGRLIFSFNAATVGAGAKVDAGKFGQ